MPPRRSASSAERNLGVSGKRIIVHSLAHARAALVAARDLRVPVTLASARGAGGYAGPLWFKSLITTARTDFPEANVTAVLDCGGEAGTTLAALRHGFKRVRFTGNTAALRPLDEIAREVFAARGAHRLGLEQRAAQRRLTMLAEAVPRVGRGL